MNLNFTGLFKTKKRIKALKIVSVFLIIWCIFIWLSYAQDSSTQKIDDMTKTAHFLVSFLSRWRALLATLAGKLMSNDLIYWSFMHLDIFLWKIWNIMKNFANYTLWFIFLFMVIKSIISKDWASDIIKKKLSWFVIAWVLIQASRFLLWAVIDVSTIAVTAIWAIPWQIIQSSMGLQKDLAHINAWGWVSLPATGEIITWILITFDPNANLTKDQQFITTEERTLDKPITQDNYLDMILPSYNTISWPLIFFGTSIFKFQDYAFTNPQTKSGRKWLMEFTLSLIIIVMYSLAMFALVIINFFRIFFLWIVIMFSPFIILLWVIGKMWIIKTDKIKWLDKISIANVMKMIFKPVIFMAYISIMMIFVIGVRAILIPMDESDVKINDEITMSSKWTDNWEWATTYNSSIKADWIFNFAINGAKKSIADLMVSFITLFLMRFLIKAAVSKWSWIDALDKRLEGMTWKAEKFAWQLPIVPIAWWIGVNSIYSSDGSPSLIKNFQEKDNIVTRMKKESEANIDKLLWTKRDYDTRQDTQKLQTILRNDRESKNYESFWNESISISNEISGWLSISNSSWKWVVEERRDKYKTKITEPNFQIANVNFTKEKSAKEFIEKNEKNIETILQQ